jgi:hypothetical protein
MADAWGVRVGKVLPEHGQVDCTPQEAHLLLELAYLTTAIDHDVNDDEVQAFRELFARLKALVVADAEPPSEADLATVLRNFRARTARGKELERITELAAKLDKDPLRELAYKVAFAVTLIDFATTDAEVAVDVALRKALAIDDAKADQLRKGVYERLEA